MKPSDRAAIGLKKRERTRAKLIQATYRLFARAEQAAMTIDDIITEAQVSRGTFYNYFQTREEIVEAMTVSLREEMKKRLSADAVATKDPAERIAIAIRQMLHRSIQDKTWGVAISRVGLVTPVTLTAENAPKHGAIADLSMGIQTNRFRVDSFEAAAALVSGTTLMALRRILEGQPSREYPEQIAKIVLMALGIPESEAHTISFKELEPLGKDLDS